MLSLSIFNFGSQRIWPHPTPPRYKEGGALRGGFWGGVGSPPPPAICLCRGGICELCIRCSWPPLPNDICAGPQSQAKCAAHHHATPAAKVATKPAVKMVACEPIPVTPVEHVRLFKVKWSRQKKWHKEPVSY